MSPTKSAALTLCLCSPSAPAPPLPRPRHRYSLRQHCGGLFCIRSVTSCFSATCYFDVRQSHIFLYARSRPALSNNIWEVVYFISAPTFRQRGAGGLVGRAAVPTSPLLLSELSRVGAPPLPPPLFCCHWTVCSGGGEADGAAILPAARRPGQIALGAKLPTARYSGCHSNCGLRTVLRLLLLRLRRGGCGGEGDGARDRGRGRSREATVRRLRRPELNSLSSWRRPIPGRPLYEMFLMNRLRLPTDGI